MASTTIDSEVFGCLFSTDKMREIFSDRALVQKWLDTEAALAKAQGELGVIPKDKADKINANADANLIDLSAVGENYKSSITIVPLLKEFKKILPGNAGEYVHWGATSQDIVDTGLVLQMKDAYNVILADMKACQKYTLDLVKKYRDTIMCGRTHVIHALPITLGYKVAVWADEFGRDIQRLEEIKKRVFVGEMAGAVGTLASQPEKGLETQTRMMEILGLEVPTIAWHVARDSQAEFVSTLAICAGTLGKISHEILTLQRTEILELEEPFFMGKVGSSTMPHKRNPQVVEGIIAVCRSVRSIAPAIVESMVSENERDWGCFLTEWEAIPRACHLIAAALDKSKDVLQHLIVYPKHMENNLYKLRGLMMSECIMMHLAPKLGRMTAHSIVYRCCMKAYEEESQMKDALKNEPEVRKAFTDKELDTMLDPHNYIGYAPQFADRVLKKYGAK
ncbi:adenylosuccinate lyase [Pectinatus haikarae]|uniref:Adenylosuccinate lyase n=1 Tax=Pectinatus haikarae TaxID=349096 RepID=A0ABT9Y740_9FIRM|nr:adenylosuccinate lyase [Pectinatus haikarae]MDQ0202964.1 adenylosuccinate lyase [Pectinatus haikarae]